MRGFRLEELDKARKLQQEAIGLNLPAPPVLSWRAKVEDDSNEIIEEYISKCNSYTRNGLNLIANNAIYPDNSAYNSQYVYEYFRELPTDHIISYNTSGVGNDYDNENSYFVLRQGDNYKLAKMNVITKEIKILAVNINYSSLVVVDENYVYYNNKDKRLCKIKKDGSENGSSTIMVNTIRDRYSGKIIDGVLYTIGVTSSLEIVKLSTNEVSIINSEQLIYDVVKYRDKIIISMGDKIYTLEQDNTTKLMYKLSSGHKIMKMFVYNDILYSIKYFYVNNKNNVILTGGEEFSEVKSLVSNNNNYDNNIIAVILDNRMVIVGYNNSTQMYTVNIFGDFLKDRYEVDTIRAGGFIISKIGIIFHSLVSKNLQKQIYLDETPINFVDTTGQSNIGTIETNISESLNSNMLELGTSGKSYRLGDYNIEIPLGLTKTNTSRITTFDKVTNKRITAISRRFTASVEAVTFREAGIFAYVNGVNKSLLVVRDVFEEPITLQKGQSITFEYVLELAYPE